MVEVLLVEVGGGVMEKAITWLIVFITLWLLVGLIAMIPKIIELIADSIEEYDRLKRLLNQRKKRKVE